MRHDNQYNSNTATATITITMIVRLLLLPLLTSAIITVSAADTRTRGTPSSDEQRHYTNNNNNPSLVLSSLLRGYYHRILDPWEGHRSENEHMMRIRRLIRQHSSNTNSDDGKLLLIPTTTSSDDDDTTNAEEEEGEDKQYYAQWANLSTSELASLSYDASSIQNTHNHHVYGSAYLAGRGRNNANDNDNNDNGGGNDDDDDGKVEEEEELTTANSFFLRGNHNHNHNQQRHLQPSSSKSSTASSSKSSSSSWTLHTGPESDHTDLTGGFSVPAIEMQTSPMNDYSYKDGTNNNNNNKEEEEEEEARESLERLQAALQKRDELNDKFARYDTNTLYSYSDPQPQQQPQSNSNNGNANKDPTSNSGTTANGTNNGAIINNNKNNNNNNMQQFSHTATTQRQRLLTGSYAAWQWYDRSNLSTPSNLNLAKVSRLNYAFFQTNAQGYIFGTDSWADPNVLFGSYEFATSSERLPMECRGGLGRDVGREGGSLEEEEEEEEDGGGAGGGGGTRRRRRGQTTLTTDTPSTTTTNNNNNNTNNNNNPSSPQNNPKCQYFESCHRNFPNSKSCNIHKYKEGLIYRAHVSGAQVYPSIGGWTLSGSFPTVASSEGGRRRFARECVGLIRDYGFDGIDIDWEYPGYEPHGGSPRDKKNFNLLLLEIREALDKYQEETGDTPLGGGSFGLSAALPCGPANIDFLDVPYLSQVLDGMNLMTFDFHNELERVTGVNSPLYDQSWDVEEGLSVDGCVKNYYEGGAGDFAAKISIGVPFYGKTYSFSTELNGFHSNTEGRSGGKADQSNWPQDLGTPVYYNILEKMAKGSMISKRHEPTMTQYAYFKDGSGLVTYDDPQAVCDKADYVNKNLLGGLFVWEMSGDLMEDLETPLLDSINRKLEETNFDCRLISSPEDGTIVGLPPPASKGPSQFERRPDENVVTSLINHLDKAEDGELVSGGGGRGAFTRSAFVYRTFDGRLYPSYMYRYSHFVDSLKTMATTGVDGNFFYLGHGQEGGDTAEETDQRDLQANNFGSDEESTLGPTEVSQQSLVYGLVNIAAYLAQAMTDSIIHDACDELNVDYLPDNNVDGRGLEDGKDIHRFPISNACGQDGRSYQDEICDIDDSKYDCVSQMNIEQLANMEAQGISRGQWGGAPGPFYCGPKAVHGTTGFWDAMVGRADDNNPTPNDFGRTDVEGCCFWGRGSLHIRGTCLYGKLNYHLGKNKADREGPENALFPDVNFCEDPGQICAGTNSVPLRWISGMYHWMENVQKYNKGGFNYQDELVRYVNENLVGTSFFDSTTNIHVLGCHDGGCTQRSLKDRDDRLRSFEKVLSLFGLQFGSHADPEPPFRAFPGQQEPTLPPTMVPEVESIITPSPTPAPVEPTETEIVNVNVFLTGVPEGKNMTNDEQLIFETLMLDMLVPRLGTVDVNVDDVTIDYQNPEPDFVAESDFESQSGNSGEEKPVLQLVMNVTISYAPPVPEGVRDWSIYMKSWIESFGNPTMVEIFTSPKHPQHPQTNSKFWDDLEDVSASNVHPPNTDPTGTPTPAPTFIVYPDNSTNTYIYAGVGAGVGLCLCCFCLFFCYKLREFRQQKNAPRQRSKTLRFDDDDEDEESFHKPQDRDFDQTRKSKPLPKVAEEYSYESEESESSSDSDSSDDSSSESSEDSSSSEEEEDETVNTNDQSAAEYSASTYDDKSRSVGTGRGDSYYSEGDDVVEAVSATGQREIAITENESVSADEGDEEESASTYDDTATKSKSMSSFLGDASAELSEPHSTVSDGDKMMKMFDDVVERVQANDPTLKQVVLDNQNQIMGKQYGPDDLWNSLVGNNYVERLSLRTCNMTDEEAAALSLALVDNTSITHVWLGDNDITSEGVEYLIATLESNQTIVYLDLAGNPDIDPDLENEVKYMLEPREQAHRENNDNDEVAQLMERVRNNDPALVELDLYGMNLGSREDAMALFDNLAGNTYIEKVDLSQNGLDDDCMSSISLALVENSSIQELILADNAIYSEGAEYMIGTLDTNTTLLKVDLTGNMVDQNIIEEINATLEQRREATSSRKTSKLRKILRIINSQDPSFTDVNLDGIDIANAAEQEELIESFGDSIIQNVSLNDSGIDDLLIAALSLALVDNKTITHVSLRDNNITSEGGEYLLGTLDSNTTITHLDLEGNMIDANLLNEIDAILSLRQQKSRSHDRSYANEEKSYQSSCQGSAMTISGLIEQVQSNDPALTDLSLDNMHVDTYEIEALFEALAYNTEVVVLSLIGTGVDDTLAAALSLALVENEHITDILLSDNQITSEGCEYLLGTLDSNTTVSYIELSGNPIDEHLMHELESITSSRNAQTSPSKEAQEAESNVDFNHSKPPMHEVPEESEAQVAKRKAIMAIMKDSSIPSQEKNQRILELQQQYYVPKDNNGEAPQAQETKNGAADGNNSIHDLIDRVLDNDRKLKEIELNGQELSPDNQKDLFVALAQNRRVKSLSLVNCNIDNEGAGELIKTLGANTTITYVNLEDNQITSNVGLDFMSVLNGYNETLQYLELKDNRVRSGLISQIDKLLEKRRPGYVEPAPVAAVATAEVIPVAATVSADVENASSSHRPSSKSGSKKSKSGKSKRSRKPRHDVGDF